MNFTQRVDLIDSHGEKTEYYVELTAYNPVTKRFRIYLDFNTPSERGFISNDYTRENYRLYEKWFNEYVKELENTKI